MEVEHFIGLGVLVVIALLAAWLVWTCMCKGEDEDEDVESQMGDEEVKSVNSRTKVISNRPNEFFEEDDNSNHQSKKKNLSEMAQLQQAFVKPKSKHKNSCYVQSSRAGLADPFGEWTRREKIVDDTEALSGIKTYRKSPVLPHRR